jgi:hypothetical protein
MPQKRRGFFVRDIERHLGEIVSVATAGKASAL